MIKTAVIGVGNILMGDEGIGVRAIEALGRHPLAENITLIDGGTAFPALTGDLTDFDKLIIVDAVNGGASPGTIYRFQLEEILEGQKQTRHRGAVPTSLHDLGVIEALVLERFRQDMRGQPAHGEVVIVGVEPERIALSMDLSPTLKNRLPQLLQTVLGELEQTPAPNGGQRGRRYEEESS